MVDFGRRNVAIVQLILSWGFALRITSWDYAQ